MARDKGQDIEKIQRNKHFRSNFLVITVVVAIVLILLINVICIMLACYPSLLGRWLGMESVSTDSQGNEKTSNVHYEIRLDAVLISTGVSIIGIAISVWAALNITNVLERKDFEALRSDLDEREIEYQNTIKDISDEQKKELNTVKNKYDEELSALKDQIGEELERIQSNHLKHTKQQEKNSKNQLLSEMLKSVSDCTTEYIMGQFQKSDVIEKIPYAELTHIEQCFAQVYSLHKHDKNTETLVNIADQGIEESNNLLSKIDRNDQQLNLIVLYLEYRIGEFNFYKIYCCYGKKRIQVAQNAIDQYIKCVSLFDVLLPEYENQNKLLPQEYGICPEAKKKIGAYLCNSIGEAYSKIVQDATQLIAEGVPRESVDEYGKKAVFYCAYAVKWSKEGRETYYRNLGCALEHVYAADMYLKENAVTIMEMYQKAFDASMKQDTIPEKVFYTWLSFNRKMSNHIIDRIRGVGNGDLWLRNKSTLVTNELIRHGRRAIQYGRLAKETYESVFAFRKFYAYTLRDVCVWEILSNGRTKTAYRYYNQFKATVDQLKVFCPEESKWDLFMRELNQYVIEIKDYMESPRAVGANV